MKKEFKKEIYTQNICDYKVKYVRLGGYKDCGKLFIPDDLKHLIINESIRFPISGVELVQIGERLYKLNKNDNKIVYLVELRGGKHTAIMEEVITPHSKVFDYHIYGPCLDMEGSGMLIETDKRNVVVRFYQYGEKYLYYNIHGDMEITELMPEQIADLR
jgi:hypothetical protein